MSRPRLHCVSALLIRQRNYGEADRIIVLLTRERGKVSAIAKGVRRARAKLAGALQLFCHAEVLLAEGRSLDSIAQAQPIDAFSHLGEDMARYAHACYCCEMVDALMEDEAPDETVFDLVLESLRALDHGGDAPTVGRGFELKLFTHLGYGPEVDTCVSCGVEVEGGEAGFSPQEGGILCSRCRQANGGGALVPGAVQAMRDLIALPMEDIGKRKLTAVVGQELERLMRLYVDYRLERPLKSAGLLRR
jgi:DNA repair protein RecO (recombination protein O)